MKKFFQSHWKLVAAVATTLILLVIWVLFAGSARQQSSFRQTDDRVKQAKILAAAAFKGDEKERIAAIVQLSGMKKSSTCRGDWWNEWQQSVISGIKTDAKRCQDREDSLAKVVNAAQATSTYISGETGISKQISTLAVDSSAKDWPTKAKTAAQGALKIINSIRVDSSLTPVQKVARARTEAIISAWNSVEVASAKQDKNTYLAAESQLKQAYADLAAVADVSDTQLMTLLSSLATSITSL